VKVSTQVQDLWDAKLWAQATYLHNGLATELVNHLKIKEKVGIAQVSPRREP
jgi:hypothetical protein